MLGFWQVTGSEIILYVRAAGGIARIAYRNMFLQSNTPIRSQVDDVNPVQSRSAKVIPKL